MRLRELRRLLVDDEAQDLVEYALLTAFVGLAGMAGWAAIQAAIQQIYAAWDTAEQNLWQPPNP
jgi:hypothetical protein